MGMNIMGINTARLANANDAGLVRDLKTAKLGDRNSPQKTHQVLI